MPIRVQCSACGKSYNAPDSAQGKRMRCKCGSAIGVSATPLTNAAPPTSVTPPVKAAPPIKQPVAPAAQPVTSPLPNTNPSAFAIQTDSPTTPVSTTRTPRNSKPNLTVWYLVGGSAVVLIAVALFAVMSFNSDDIASTAQSNSHAPKNDIASNQNTNVANQSADKISDSANRDRSVNNNSNPDPAPRTTEQATNDDTPGENKVETTSTMPTFQPDWNITISLPPRVLPNSDEVPALVERLPKAIGEERDLTQEALIRHGEAAVESIVQSIRKFDSDRSLQNTNILTMQTLEGIGRPAVKSLIEIVQDKSISAKTRAMAINSLGAIGPSAREAIPFLIESYKNPESPASINIINPFTPAFAKMGPEAQAVVPMLIEILGDGRAKTKHSNAAQTLAAIGPAARAAVPALRKHLLQGSYTSQEAALALGNIGPDAAAAMPELIELVKRKDKVVSYRVFTAIGGIGPAAKEAVPSLIECFTSSTHGFTNSRIADALGKIGPDASAALPVLHEAFTKADVEKGQEPRIYYRLAIARIEGDEAGAVPYLVGSLFDNDHNARPEAARQLGTLGAAGESAIPEIVKLIQTNPHVAGGIASVAVEALGNLGQHGKSAVGILISIINAQEQPARGKKLFRLYAIEAMGKIGKADPRIVPGLQTIARDDPSSDARKLAREKLFTLN